MNNQKSTCRVGKVRLTILEPTATPRLSVSLSLTDTVTAVTCSTSWKKVNSNRKGCIYYVYLQHFRLWAIRLPRQILCLYLHLVSCHQWNPPTIPQSQLQAKQEFQPAYAEQSRFELTTVTTAKSRIVIVTLSMGSSSVSSSSSLLGDSPFSRSPPFQGVATFCGVTMVALFVVLDLVGDASALASASNFSFFSLFALFLGLSAYFVDLIAFASVYKVA